MKIPKIDWHTKIIPATYPGDPEHLKNSMPCSPQLRSVFMIQKKETWQKWHLWECPKEKTAAKHLSETNMQRTKKSRESQILF